MIYGLLFPVVIVYGRVFIRFAVKEVEKRDATFFVISGSRIEVQFLIPQRTVQSEVLKKKTRVGYIGYLCLSTGFRPLQSKNASIKIKNRHKIKGADFALFYCNKVPPGGMWGPLDLTLTRLIQQGLV